jgi:hypothetical protein
MILSRMFDQFLSTKMSIKGGKLSPKFNVGGGGLLGTLTFFAYA